MPIDIDRFEEEPAAALRIDRSSNEDRVYEFLAANPDEAFTLEEIQTAIDRPLIDLAARLTDLEARGLVRGKGSYWAADPDGVTERDGDRPRD